MAKPKIPNQRKQSLEHKARIERYVALINQLYARLNNEAAKIAERTGHDDTAPFRWSDYPETKSALQKLQADYVKEMGAIVMSGTSNEWKESNIVQDLVAKKVLKAYTGTDKAGEEYKRYFESNPDALEAFRQRKENGMKLSDRVWNLSEQYKTELEDAISAAIEPGQSAMSLAVDIKQYLNEPDLMFRRFRYKDESGQWKKKWKRKITDEDGKTRFIDCDKGSYCNQWTGRGYYKSSAKNARRLARTEINMAYRTAEQARWEQFDFVVGYEVKTTQNGHHVTDICDDLKGKYPKSFKFTGWHPMCMCYCIPILKTEDEFWSDDDVKKSVNEVTDVPKGFADWIEKNAERISAAEERGKLPYFIADNAKYTDPSWKPGKAAASANPMPALRPKTPLEIADERHARRTAEEAEKIQRRWSTRQMNNLWEALDDQFLPKETSSTLAKLNGLLQQNKFTEFNKTAQPLISAVTRHKNRTMADASRIQKAWDANRGKAMFEREYESLCNFKLRRTNYRMYLTKAKEAYENGDYEKVKYFIDAAKYEKRIAEQKAAEKIAERAATIYKEPTLEEYIAAMNRNKSLGIFSTEQDANNRVLEKAIGIKQGDIMDWKTADSNNSNPGYKRKTASADGYVHNCQTCTMAYEARRRGFKIVAAPSPGEEGINPNNFYTFTQKNGITWRERFLNTDGTKPTPITSAHTTLKDTIVAKRKFIEDNTATEGRYEIYCAWKRKGAHVFIVERDKDGTLLWIDPQTGKTGDIVLLYTDSMKPDSIEILRIDNKIINPKFASRMIKKTK